MKYLEFLNRVIKKRIKNKTLINKMMEKSKNFPKDQYLR